VRLRGIATVAIVAIVIAIVVVGGLAYYFVAVPAGGGSTSPIRTTSPTNTTSTGGGNLDVSAAVNAHLNAISARNIPNIMTVYTDAAVVHWTGQASGLQGDYSGKNNIQLLYQTALGTAQSMKLVVKSLTPSGTSATAVLNISGTSSVLGAFNGTINASFSYVQSGATWQINTETWNFVVFNVANAAGETTFPQWRTIGGPIVESTSPDAFKQFIYTYGGEGMTLVIVVFAAALAVAMVARRWK